MCCRSRSFLCGFTGNHFSFPSLSSNSRRGNAPSFHALIFRKSTKERIKVIRVGALSPTAFREWSIRKIPSPNRSVFIWVKVKRGAEIRKFLSRKQSQVLIEEVARPYGVLMQPMRVSNSCTPFIATEILDFCGAREINSFAIKGCGRVFLFVRSLQLKLSPFFSMTSVSTTNVFCDFHAHLAATVYNGRMARWKSGFEDSNSSSARMKCLKNMHDLNIEQLLPKMRSILYFLFPGKLLPVLGLVFDLVMKHAIQDQTTLLSIKRVKTESQKFITLRKCLQRTTTGLPSS